MNKHAIDNIRIYLTLAAAVLLSVLVSCEDEKDDPEPVPEPPDPVVVNAARTVLVYMVATNNLGTSGFDTSDIQEMQQGAAAGDIGEGRMILYHASPKGIVLKEVTATGIDTLKVYDDSQLSVSIDRMRQVVADVKELAPADDYAMVMWSHATGWLQDGIDEQLPDGRLRSYGSDGVTSGKKMNITSMAYALEDAGLSYIYFDCCYMGSVETLYELRHCAQYFVSSPTEVPADGMPYHLNLKHLFDTESPIETSMTNAATTTFDYYNDEFKQGYCPCTMTVVRSDKLEALAQATRRIYAVADRTYNADYDYQKFKVSRPYYYYDLEEYVESLCDDDQLMQDWRTAMAEAVLLAKATPYIWSSTPINRCCGLSTNIITNESSLTSNNYNTLSWYADVAVELSGK